MEQIQAMMQAFQPQETPEQIQYRQQQEETLNRLIGLEEQLAKAGEPSQELLDLRAAITEQQKVLKDLTPEKFLETQPGLKDVGITQSYLQREVAKQRDPIASALSDMLLSESLLTQQIQAEQQGIRAQQEALTNIMGLREGIAGLRPQAPEMPAAIQSEMMARFLWPEEFMETPAEDKLLSVSEA